MAVKIELKRSSVPGKIPTTASLDLGELAINTYDGAVYLKQEVDTTQSIVSLVSTTYTGSFPGTASYAATASWSINALTASYAVNVSGTIDNAISSSYALNATNASTASFAPAYLPLTATSSMLAPYVLTSQTSSMRVLSSSFAVTASYARTASYAQNAQTASYAQNAVSASYALNSTTASAILGGKATHIPYFITDTTLATSSLYQSGSSTVVINQDNATIDNPEALYVYQPNPTSINVISGKGNLNSYLQLNIQNTNQGTNASSDVVATAGNGNENGNYIDMGINSDNFSGFLGGPNDAYLYATGSHLHIGNATPNKPLQFFVGGPDTEVDRKFELNANNLHNITGSLEIDTDLVVLGGITGSLYGSASYAETASFAPAYLPLTGGTINGNVTVNGTASVTFLNVTYESASVIYSSGSNIFGDNTDDVQTLVGTVIVSGSQQITGSLNASSITGSLFGSASYALTASYALNAGGSAVDTGSFVTTSSFNAFTSSVVTTSSFNAYTGSNTSQFAGTASYAFTASLAQTASFAQTASYVLEAVSSSFATTASLAQTASFAQTASYVLQAVSSSFAQTASYVQTAQTASFVAAANVVGTVTSASHALQSNTATSADYAAIAGNGGVTQLIAGSGITLLPSNGQGAVTVIASAGGGVTIISGSLVTGSFVNTTSFTFNHDLGTRTPIITVFDSNYNQIIPENIQLVDTASAIITFPTQESGFAIGSTGGTTGTALSASYATFSDYAQTASYYIETDPVFVAKSASLATTGSNTFRGNQTITGSLSISGSTTFNGSVTLVNGATGSLFGTASWATSASNAINSQTASYLNPLYQDVILTGSIIMSGSSYISGVDYIDFDTTASNAGAVGRLKWNDVDGTLDLGLKGGSVTLQIGQEEVVRVVNKTGTNLTEAGYQVVRLDGAQGNRIKVALAKGDGDANSLDTIGLVTENIAINQEGFVTTYGLVRNIDTRGTLQGETWVDGDGLYLSPTTFGGITNIPPSAPSHSVRLGYVVQASPNGSIFVKVDNGYELDELHNVLINTGSLAYGDLLMRNGNGVWVNTKQLSGSYTITGSLTVSGSSTFTNIGLTTLTGSLSVTGSTTQTGNNILIGTTVLSGSIDISGSQTFTGIGNQVGNSYFTGSVNITGSTTQTGNNTLIGNTVLSGSINISGSQTFNGTSAFYGNHTLSGSNTILGNTVMSGSIEVSGSSNFHNSEFIVTGSTKVLGNFDVRGTSTFSNTTFTVTGSQYFTGSSFINGNQSLTGNSTITGSLNVIGNINVISGSSFTRWGNKLFNYAQFANTGSITATQNVSASIELPLTYFKDGVSIVSSSRMTFENTGLYNIQYAALAQQGNTTPTLRIWFRKTGSNVDNSSTIIQLENNSQTAVTSQFAQSINAGEYIEIWYHSNGANTSFPYTAAGSGFPATPSITVTVTQIA